ncbi:hypothetical protein SAZ11_41245 [Streptomyces sp. FXJ1.4098]|uniref:hypothetical protein n=1 Tax=Streptomyces sp. NPDC020845 TaxID=3365096 RepID=UPI002995C9F0|nr:hypothetical protein [Streptomyces sp. FXJ1.4098]
MAASDTWQSFPLIEGLKSRRARRFGMGMTVPGGPLEYRSKHEPVPLTEEEQAILTFAACGITGPALNDWNWEKGKGGNVMAGVVGRTISSSDALQSGAMVVMDDEATYLIRRPGDLSTAELNEVKELVAKNDFVGAYRATRVKIGSERRHPPVASPYNLTGNEWSLHTPGSTYFLPIEDLSYLYINILLEFFNEEMAVFCLDERRFFLPAGLGKFGKSKGGHLDDDPRKLKSMPMEYAERLLVETACIEMGMMLQNLGLVSQALGLGGFPHYTGHDGGWFEALDFRMAEMPISQYFRVPTLAKMVLKLRRQDAGFAYPLGLERDGEVLLKPYCPPYYESMEAAVHAVVERKFGENGIYRGGIGRGGWREPEKVAAGISGISQKAIDATVAFCEYTYQKSGRFPSYLPAYHTQMGFQSVHLDVDFYDEFYDPSVVPEVHRSHMRDWHGR